MACFVNKGNTSYSCYIFHNAAASLTWVLLLQDRKQTPVWLGGRHGTATARLSITAWITDNACCWWTWMSTTASTCVCMFSYTRYILSIKIRIGKVNVVSWVMQYILSPHKERGRGCGCVSLRGLCNSPVSCVSGVKWASTAPAVITWSSSLSR